MAQLTRFGRRVALPSTRQIMHELRVFAAQEDARRQAPADTVTPRLDPFAEPHRDVDLPPAAVER